MLSAHRGHVPGPTERRWSCERQSGMRPFIALAAGLAGTASVATPTPANIPDAHTALAVGQQPRPPSGHLRTLLPAAPATGLSLFRTTPRGTSPRRDDGFRRARLTKQRAATLTESTSPTPPRADGFKPALFLVSFFIFLEQLRKSNARTAKKGVERAEASLKA